MTRSSEAIFIAPPSQRPLLAALTDLSAAGLLAPFHWLESPSDLRGTSVPNPMLVTVEEGRATQSSYFTVVSRHGLEHLRVLVVVPLGHPADDALTPQTELHYLNLQVAVSTTRHPIRVLVPWSAQPLPAVVGHAGWTNVMLSPELSADPAYPGVVWWTRPELVAGAAAVGLAAQAGIAGSVETTPTDQATTSSGSSVSVVRTFVRHVDAYAAEQAVRGQVLSIDELVPQPVRSDTGGSHIPAFQDPTARIVSVAQTWYQRHAGTLRRPEVAVPQVEAQQIGAWAAVKMFFSFMLKALLGAPGAWLRSQIRGVKATIAQGVGDFVFGQGSGINVLVGGVDAHGHTADWRRLADAAREMAATMPADMPQVPVGRRTSFAALWQEMMEAAQALADGSGCQALGLTRHEGYVPSRDAIAPPLERGGAYVFPTQVGPFAQGTVLHAWDQMEVNRVLGELADLAQAGAAGGEAMRVGGEIQRWQQSGTHRFLQLIGGFLTYRLGQTQEEIRRYHAQLTQLLARDVTPALEQRQRRLAWWLRVLLIAAIVLVVGVFVLHVANPAVFTWAVVTLASLVIVLGWIVTSLIVFMVQQRVLFRLLHQMRARETQVPALAANLRMAVEDLADEGEAYAQFTQWASILTSFLTNPLGERQVSRHNQRDDVVLPVSFQSVQAQATDSAVADTAARLRTRVFRVGWVKEAWEDLCRTIELDLTPDEKARLLSRDLQIYSESGSGPSALTHWAAGLARHGVRSARADAAWSECLRYLGQDWAAHSLDLRVASRDGQRPLTEYRSDLAEFRMTAVCSEVFAPGRHAGTEPFTTAQAHWFREESDGLSTTLVLTDATAPLASDYFVYPAPARAQVRFDSDVPLY